MNSTSGCLVYRFLDPGKDIIVMRGSVDKSRVIAACRNPSNSEGLKQLGEDSNGRLETVQMDITNEDSIQVS